jgi:hypothetical protein
MCEYSIHADQTRLAMEGEELVSAVFPGGSLGFAAPAELRECGPVTAVCIPPGARLLLEQIPQRLQSELRIGETELVTFTQLGYEPFTYRDAVRFRNGREVLIQRLQENQRAVILSLESASEPLERVTFRNAAMFEPVEI